MGVPLCWQEQPVGESDLETGTWNWRNLRLSEPVPIGSAGSRHLTCWLIQNNAPCLRGLIPASSCQRRAFLLGSRPHLAAVAQLVRAPDCGSGGRWFESTQLYQVNQILRRKIFDALKFDVRAMSASPMAGRSMRRRIAPLSGYAYCTQKKSDRIESEILSDFSHHVLALAAAVSAIASGSQHKTISASATGSLARNPRRL